MLLDSLVRDLAVAHRREEDALELQALEAVHGSWVSGSASANVVARYSTVVSRSACAASVGLAWMSDQMGIRIPDTASDRRAGYKVGERYDTGLLSFVLPTDEAETYASRLIRSGTKMIENLHPEEKDYRPAAAFGHLGLPEPETFVKGLRKTSLCPDDLATPEGKYLQRCVDLFAHEFTPGTTRIYVRSTIEPSVTPPSASKAP